jgi:hypothetical protein
LYAISFATVRTAQEGNRSRPLATNLEARIGDKQQQYWQSALRRPDGPRLDRCRAERWHDPESAQGGVGCSRKVPGAQSESKTHTPWPGDNTRDTAPEPGASTWRRCGDSGEALIPRKPSDLGGCQSTARSAVEGRSDFAGLSSSDRWSTSPDLTPNADSQPELPTLPRTSSRGTSRQRPVPLGHGSTTGLGPHQAHQPEDNKADFCDQTCRSSRMGKAECCGDQRKEAEADCPT